MSITFNIPEWFLVVIAIYLSFHVVLEFVKLVFVWKEVEIKKELDNE